MFSNLNDIMRDARMMNARAFRLMYGENVSRWFAPDNSIRVASTFNNPELKFTPLVKSKQIEHKTPPRKDELVQFDDGFETYFGKIRWVNRAEDQVGIYVFKDKSSSTFDLSSLESTRGPGKVRWRVWQ